MGLTGTAVINWIPPGNNGAFLILICQHQEKVQPSDPSGSRVYGPTAAQLLCNRQRIEQRSWKERKEKKKKEKTHPAFHDLSVCSADGWTSEAFTRLWVDGKVTETKNYSRMKAVWVPPR